MPGTHSGKSADFNEFEFAIDDGRVSGEQSADESEIWSFLASCRWRLIDLQGILHNDTHPYDAVSVHRTWARVTDASTVWVNIFTLNGNSVDFHCTVSLLVQFVAHFPFPYAVLLNTHCTPTFCHQSQMINFEYDRHCVLHTRNTTQRKDRFGLSPRTPK